jgi:hypothetical protein
MSMSNTTKRVKEIRRKTRRKFSSEEKIRIVLDGLHKGPLLAGSRPKPPSEVTVRFQAHSSHWGGVG